MGGQGLNLALCPRREPYMVLLGRGWHLSAAEWLRFAIFPLAGKVAEKTLLDH